LLSYAGIIRIRFKGSGPTPDLSRKFSTPAGDKTGTKISYEASAVLSSAFSRGPNYGIIGWKSLGRSEEVFTKKKAPGLPMDADAATLLGLAKAEADPVRRFQLLNRAEELAPKDIMVHRALLMHGRLHERDGRNPDYRVIKSYLFHVFEHPEKHEEKEILSMARELFDHERLLTCLSFTSNAEGFLADYLEELAADYIRLFLAGDTRHVPTLFGFSRRTSLSKCLAVPMSDIIGNILQSAYLKQEEQVLLARAFYRACHRFLSGETEPLDAQLGPQILSSLA